MSRPYAKQMREIVSILEASPKVPLSTTDIWRQFSTPINDSNIRLLLRRAASYGLINRRLLDPTKPPAYDNYYLHSLKPNYEHLLERAPKHKNTIRTPKPKIIVTSVFNLSNPPRVKI